jgi:hypothetical protein
MRIGFLRSSLAIAVLAATPQLAQAQMFDQIGKGGGKPAAAPPKTAPPPALPGAESSGTAAPLSRLPSDMEPTEALFDAINRGDASGARDAIGRGADLHGQNVLGMTPLELAVDLGRNDISFMLLSMRGADDDRSRLSPVGKAAGGKAPAGKAAVGQTAAKPPTRANQSAGRSAGKVAASPPAPAQTARLFSGDGGAPNPNAGFLGFDTSRR